jgi:DNA primase
VDFPSSAPWNDLAWEYLIDRGISKEIIWERGIYFSGYGKYANRIILPIKFKGDKVSFQARAVDGQKPKYQSPKGFPLSRVLFNYDNYNGENEVVLCEGQFDCLRLHKEGICAMATFGKKISSSQIGLLSDLGIKKIKLFYDPDALSEVIRIFPILNKMISVEVIISRDGLDPADTQQLEEALSNPINNMGTLLSYSINGELSKGEEMWVSH